MRFLRKWIRRAIMACFGRTQNVPALPPPARTRSRVAGPALAAFDSEMLAGDSWGKGNPNKWQWLVPIGGGPVQDGTSVRELAARAIEPPTITPIPPAPAVQPPPREIKVPAMRGGHGPPTSRMVTRPAHPRLIARVRK